MNKRSEILLLGFMVLSVLTVQLVAIATPSVAYEPPTPYFKLTLIASTNIPTRVLHAQVISRELWKIGIDAELVLVGFDPLIRRMFYSRNFETYAGNGFDIAFVGFGAPFSVAGLGGYHSYNIDKVSGGLNYYPLNNSRLDALIDNIATTPDSDQRRADILQALNIIVWESHPTTALYHQGNVVAQDAALQNFDDDITGYFVSWADAYFDADKQSELVVAVGMRFSDLLFRRNEFIDAYFNRPASSSLYEISTDGLIRPVLAAADPIPLNSAARISDYVDVAQISADSPYHGANSTTLWGSNPNIDSSQYNATATASNHPMVLIRLREGMPWQPGYGYTADMKLNVTADDLIWTWNYRETDELPYSPLGKFIGGDDVRKAVEKINMTMVKVNFPVYNAAEWLITLAESSSLLPRHILDPKFDATPYGGAIGVTPDGTTILPYAEQDRYRRSTGAGDRPIVSTGPYYLDHWDEIQQLATYRKFDDWGGYGNNSLWQDPRYQRNNIETLGIRVIDNPNTALIALENGEVDMISASANDVQYLRTQPEIAIKISISSGSQTMGYNTFHPKLHDRYVRLAISHLVPRERFVTYLLNGIGIANEVSGTPVDSPYYPSEEEWKSLGLDESENVVDPETGEILEFQGHIRYSVAKAQALMEKAGYDMAPFREAVRREEAGEQKDQSLEPLPLLIASGVTIAVVGAALILGRRYWQQYKLAQEPPSLRLSRQRKQLMDAMQLKQSPRMSEKAQAQEIFQQLANAEVLVPDLSMYAMLNLCDLFMDEVRAYGEHSVFLEAQRLSNRISNIAHEQGASNVLVEALLLRSKFALLEGNISKADKLLARAATVAKENYLSRLAEKVAEEQFAMEKEYEQWERLITEAAPIRERLEYSRLQNYIASAVRVMEQEESIADLSDASKHSYV
ncbi:MAG: ABC transporter substrate-binding protein [Candidatus Heimdallarchaeota archaeon]